MFLLQIYIGKKKKKKGCIQNIWEAYIIVHGTVPVPSGLEWGVWAESPHLLLDWFVVGNHKFGILQLVHKHKIFIKSSIITASPQALDSSSVRELFPQVCVGFLDMLDTQEIPLLVTFSAWIWSQQGVVVNLQHSS